MVTTEILADTKKLDDLHELMKKTIKDKEDIDATLELIKGKIKELEKTSDQTSIDPLNIDNEELPLTKIPDTSRSSIKDNMEKLGYSEYLNETGGGKRRKRKTNRKRTSRRTNKKRKSIKTNRKRTSRKIKRN